MSRQTIRWWEAVPAVAFAVVAAVVVFAAQNLGAVVGILALWVVVGLGLAVLRVAGWGWRGVRR